MNLISRISKLERRSIGNRPTVIHLDYSTAPEDQDRREAWVAAQLEALGIAWCVAVVPKPMSVEEWQRAYPPPAKS